MPEHISVTKSVCGKWVADLGFFLLGKCGGHEYFYGAYGGIKYKKGGPKVSLILVFVFDQQRQMPAQIRFEDKLYYQGWF